MIEWRDVRLIDAFAWFNRRHAEELVDCMEYNTIIMGDSVPGWIRSNWCTCMCIAFRQLFPRLRNIWGRTEVIVN